MDDIIIEVLDEKSSVIEIYNDDGLEFDVAVAVGPKGDTGPAGPQGPPGNLPAGTQNDVLTYDEESESWFASKTPLRYVYTQQAALATWSITHNMGYMPSITVIDSGGNEVEGNIVYNDIDTLTLMFSSEMSGTAYLS